MRADLALRPTVTTRLQLSPQQLLAAQLLALPLLKLQDAIRRELEENPLLEDVQEGAHLSERDHDLPDHPETPLSPTVLPGDDGAERARLDFQASRDRREERSLVSYEDLEDRAERPIAAPVASLADELESQLRLESDDPLIRRVGEHIIRNLDDDGYLRADVGEIAAACGVSVAAVDEVLALIHGFEPPGVAARNIQECLLLQARRDPALDPLSLAILQHHFDDFAHGRHARIARSIRLPVDRVHAAAEAIRRLELKPGRAFGSHAPQYVRPDVVVERLGNEYVVLLNDDWLPRLGINRAYRTLLTDQGTAPGAHAYVRERLRAAQTFIRCVYQRQRTIRRVAESIVRFQREFLDRGPSHLRPLFLREVARDIAMHESTVSRATHHKYVQTSHGLFPLKHLFGHAVLSDREPPRSALAVQHVIHDLIAGEDRTRPLSDLAITRLLNQRGLAIKRRTVANYRGEHGILPSRLRRHLEHRRRCEPEREDP